MVRTKRWAGLLLLVLPLSAASLACGDGEDERSALEQDELDRELEMALQGDSAPASFKDTAVSATPEPAPAARPAPAPRRETRATAPRTEPRPAPRPVERAPQPTTRVVPAGTTFAVRLDQTLSTDKNQPGDPFTATVTDPVVDANDGTVLIPAGATVRGRVTAVNKSGHIGETAVIKVAFESISFNGQSYPLEATVVEAKPERRTRTSGKEQAAKVAAGAAAGAILGKVLGKDTEDAVKGAVIGAAAGTAVAMGTADVDAVLAAGSRMVIRTDTPVEVARR
ncbi:MAG TPA: TrbI/VirB10 family protein [Longimicrobiales bacterium]